MTHEQLREAAVQWLTRRKKCSVVISEVVSAAFETPDAIGWKGGFSYLVECKASRSDFLANRHKPHVRGERGVGQLRYFLCLHGLITAADLVGQPECGWGLLWADPTGRVKQVKEAMTRDSDARGEIAMLVSALRRVRTREFLTLNLAVENED